MLTTEQQDVIAEVDPHQVTAKLLRRLDKALTNEVLADAIIDGEIVGTKADYLIDSLGNQVIAQRRTERVLDRILLKLNEIAQILGSLSRGDLAQPPQDARPAAPVSPSPPLAAPGRSASKARGR